MPLMVSQEQLPDGLRITCTDGTVYQYTSANLPSNIRNGTAAACETYLNGQLATVLAGRDFFAKVHVITVVPLVLWLVTASYPLPDYSPTVPPWNRLG